MDRSGRKAYSMKPSIYLLKAEIKNPAVSRLLKGLTFYYPFTVSGTILFIVSLTLLGKSYANGNSYGIILSFFAFFTLLALSVLGRLQAGRFSRIQVQWDSSQPLYAGMEGTGQQFQVDGIKTFSFYRLHVRISGRMTVGRNAYLYISRETSTAEGNAVNVPLYFPFSGEFQARGSLKMLDIFGLSRARFCTDQLRTLIVQPAHFKDSRSYPMTPAGGFEDENRQKSSDEERYYMREYIPGDRFRDINWKSSSRISQLFTKISPYTQEKTRLIHIDFRHYRKNRRETVESIVHLNQLKSWLLSFIRKVKNENPGYHFLIKTEKGAVRLETDEDIEGFSLDVSSLFFQAAPSDYQAGPGADEIFIFSTPYDKNLPQVLASYRKVNTHVLRTVSKKDKGERGKMVHVFKPGGSMPFPGPWILFRERILAKPEVGASEKCRLEECPIEVKVF